MNAGRMRVFADTEAAIYRAHAQAERRAVGIAQGFGSCEKHIKCHLDSMRFFALEMRRTLERSKRRTAA